MAGREITGRHVLVVLVGFFGVVFAVNGVMTWAALSTFSGIETQDAYQRGRAYNATLEAAAAQARLGWTVAVEPRFAAGADGHDAVVEFTVRDGNGAPVSGLEGAVTFWRPVVEGKDTTVPVVEERRGEYRAASTLPAPGRWELRFDLTRPGGAPFYLQQRVWVPSDAGGGSGDHD